MKRTLLLGPAILLVACGGESAPPPVAPPPPAPAEAVNAPAPAPAATEAPAPKLSKAELAKKTLMAMHAASNAHDAKATRALYAADGVKQIPMPDGWKDVKGGDELEKQAAQMFSMAPDMRWATTRVFQNGDVIACEYVVTGTHEGKKIGVRGLAIDWFDDEGKIKKERVYLDQITGMVQAGRIPGKAPDPAAAPTGEAPWIVAKADDTEGKLVETYKAGWPVAWGKKDRKAYEGLLADDFVQEDVAWGMTAKGKTEAGKGMEKFTKAVPDVAVTVDSAWAAGDSVIAELTMKGTQKGALGPVKATNKPFTGHMVNVADYKDGKLVRSTVYMNALEILGQLGVAPNPPEKKADAKGEKKADEKKPEKK